MTDTIRNQHDLLNLIQENTTGQITAQDIRDFVVSCNIDGTTAHLVDTNNPHNVTAAQVGAPTSVAGVSNPGGNISISAGANVTVTPDNVGKTITIAATGGGGSGNVNYKGAWNPATAYSTNDEVQFGNTTYVALSSTTGNQPPDSTHWQPVGALGTVFNVKDYGASGSANQYTGSITAATNTLTLSGSHDFKVGHGIVVRGAGPSHTIAAPAAPVLSNAGTAGAATYTYRLCSLTGDGGWSAVGTATSTTTGNTALGTSNYNNICWTQVATGTSGGNTGNSLGGFVIYGRTSGSDFPLVVINAACTNCRAVYFSAVGYTSAVQTDIGKALNSQAGYNGTLVGYDNTARVWFVLPNDFSADLFASAGASLSLSTAGGTGAGTTVTAPITGGGCDWAYYWSDMGDTAKYGNRTIAWRPFYEYTEGDWIFHPFNNTGAWYKAYKCRLTHKSGSTAPTLTNTINWASTSPDGDVYWRREEPFLPSATAPASAVPNALVATVSSVLGSVLTLSVNAGATVSGQEVYHDDLAAVQSANNAMVSSSTSASLYFPAGTYQFITGSLANDSRWTSYGAVSPYSAALFIFSNGSGGGWTLDNNAQIRVMALAMNAYMTDNKLVGQNNLYYTVFNFGTVSSWHMLGSSNTSRMTWEPYGTAFYESTSTSVGQTGNNAFTLRSDYSGGTSNYNENLVWENLTIDGFTKVSNPVGATISGSQGERWVNCLFNYGGGYHDDCIYALGGTTFERCTFVARRPYASRAIYGASVTQTGKIISSINTSTSTVTINSHGFGNGQQIRLRSNSLLGSATMPAGLVETAQYYVGATTTNTFQLFSNRSDAITATNPISITSSGSAGGIYVNYSEMDRLVVEKCVFDRAGSSGRYAIRIRSDGTIVSRCKFLNCDPPTINDGASDCVFAGNYFYKSGLGISGAFCTVTGNVFLDSNISGSPTDSAITGNSFWTSGDTNIDWSGFWDKSVE